MNGQNKTKSLEDAKQEVAIKYGYGSFDNLIRVQKGLFHEKILDEIIDLVLSKIQPTFPEVSDEEIEKWSSEAATVDGKLHKDCCHDLQVGARWMRELIRTRLSEQAVDPVELLKWLCESDYRFAYKENLYNKRGTSDYFTADQIVEQFKQEKLKL